MKTTLLALLTTIALSIYPATGVVVDTQYDPTTETSIVTVETGTGHLYSYYGADDLVNGDIISLIMWNANTPDNVVDDWVVDARYSGFWFW